MERTIDGILTEAVTAPVIKRVRVIKRYGELVPVGLVMDVFHEDETHYYAKAVDRNLTVELSKKYFEVI